MLKNIKCFMKKAFKFRLYPTIDQSNQLDQHIGSCRFVYNWALDQKVKTYEQTMNQFRGLTYTNNSEPRKAKYVVRRSQFPII